MVSPSKIMKLLKKRAELKDSLEKGAARKLAPYNPNKENIELTQDWVNDSNHKARENLPPASGAARFRALNKLRGATKTRLNPETNEREYLLHRGMSNHERDSPEPAKTSWTPDYNKAYSFASDYNDDDEHGYGPSHVVSAWIPESKMHAFPFMHGNNKKVRGFRNEFEVVVNPHPLNIHDSKTYNEASNEFAKKIILDTKPKLEDINNTFGPEGVRRKIRENLGKSDDLEKSDKPIKTCSCGHKLTTGNAKFIGEQDVRGIPAFEGKRMLLYNCPKCDTTVTHLTPDAPTPMKKSEELEKGLNGDYKKEGYTFYHMPDKKDPDRFVVYATHPEDGDVGYARIQKEERRDRIKPYDLDHDAAIWVHKDHRRKGLGSAMYEYAEQLTGLRIHPSPQQSEAADSMWSNEARPFGKSQDDLEKGLNGDWEKEGYSLNYKMDGNKTSSLHTVIAKDKEGNVVGAYKIGAPMAGGLVVFDSKTHPDHTRKGLASSAYALVEQKTGKKLKPLESEQSEDAKALWNQPNRPFGKLNKSFYYKGVLYPETSDPEGLPHHSQPWVKGTTKSGAPTWTLRPDLARNKEREFIHHLKNFKDSNHLSEQGNKLLSSLAENVFNSPDRHHIRASSKTPENPAGDPEIRMRHLTNVLKGTNGYGVTENDGKLHIWAERHSGNQAPVVHHWTYDGNKVEFQHEAKPMKLAKSTGELTMRNLLPKDTRPDQDVQGVKTHGQFNLARKLAEQTVPKEVRHAFSEQVHKPLDHMENKNAPKIASLMSLKYGGNVPIEVTKPEGVTYKDDEGGKAFVSGEDMSHTIRNHEAIHHLFNKLASVYGDSVHDDVRDHLLNLVHPGDRHAIQAHIARIGYHPATFADEILPHMYEIMNNPKYRNTFKIMNKKSDQEMQEMVGRMKRSWGAIRQAADNMKGVVR